MIYIYRMTDSELAQKISSTGAVLISGAKACEKTESAKQTTSSY